jgi:hypothetical protein
MNSEMITATSVNATSQGAAWRTSRFSQPRPAGLTATPTSR